MTDGKPEDKREPADVVRFPLSRTTPAGSAGGYKNLGTGAMARHLNMTKGR